MLRRSPALQGGVNRRSENAKKSDPFPETALYHEEGKVRSQPFKRRKTQGRGTYQPGEGRESRGENPPSPVFDQEPLKK